MKLLKYHGSGNDFIVFDEVTYGMIHNEATRSEIVKNICNRGSKLGADGVLFVQNSDSADAKMRIFNSDGSEPEMCGNGLRCFGRYIMEKSNKNEVIIETMKNNYKVLKNDRFSSFITGYEIIINNVKLVDDEDVISLVKTCDIKDSKVRHLTVSNPHLVIARDELIQTEELELSGGKYNRLIKNGINTNYFKVIKDDSIYVKTYERGVGITLSCGTGMISCATVYCLNSGFLNKWLNVYNDGGKVLCKVVLEDNNIIVHFVGNATHVYDTEMRLIDGITAEKLDFEGNFYLNELNSYELFFKQTRNELKEMNFNGYKENM